MERLLDAPTHEGSIKTPILTCTLVGSFRYMDLFNQTINRLTAANVRVPSPAKGKVIGVENGFKRLDHDAHLPPFEAESGFMQNLLWSDLGIIINPVPTSESSGGYIGATAATEIVFAQKYGVPFLAINPIDKDLDKESASWSDFCSSIPVCHIDRFIERLHNPFDSLHLLPCQNHRVGRYIPDLEDMALQVLSADWIKYKGLGYVVEKAQKFRLTT